MSIPIIDLFAGPGGLGEGFSALRRPGSTEKLFKIALSVEMDRFAHRTLELRSFYRYFPDNAIPQAYYEYLSGTDMSREALFEAYPEAADHARNEALQAKLGTDTNKILARIRRALADNPKYWILIGGPPCQAYSMAGRARLKAEHAKKQTDFEKDPRHLLYQEYLKIIARFGPPVFVMENVRGMLSSKLNGKPIVDKILHDLSDPRSVVPAPDNGWDYTGNVRYHIYSLVVPHHPTQHTKPDEYLIRSELYGIPQTRHRVILIGVRIQRGRRRVPALLQQQANLIPIEQVIADLPAIRSQLSNRCDSQDAWLAAVQSASNAPFIAELAQMSGLLPDEDELVLAIRQNAFAAAAHVNNGGERLPTISVPDYNPGQWYTDPLMTVTCNHTARSHMPADLHRYLFVSCFGQVRGISPKTRNFPPSLLPAHVSIQNHVEGEDEIFDDRFRVQIMGAPATTITSHIAKDGHYNIHFDPSQCRALTVREAARVQTFPDNYFFEGPRTEQYKQVGNAVPPLLARQIAKIVYNMLITQRRLR